MKVYIDIREQDAIQRVIDYWKSFKKKWFHHIDEIESTKLETSDICTSDGFVGIERKSSADFVGSICGSGKLKQQLHELKSNFKNAFLFVEGYDGILDCIQQNPQIHPNVFLGTYASVLAHSKVPICFVGEFYVPIVLLTIEKFYDGKDIKYQQEYTPVRRSVTKSDHQINIVRGLPNIGVTEGKELLQHYNNSIYKMVKDAVENNDKLLEVKGIGKKTAQYIKEVLQ